MEARSGPSKVSAIVRGRGAGSPNMSAMGASTDLRDLSSPRESSPPRRSMVRLWLQKV